MDDRALQAMDVTLSLVRRRRLIARPTAWERRLGVALPNVTMRTRLMLYLGSPL